jgi:hypothetical protein
LAQVYQIGGQVYATTIIDAEYRSILPHARLKFDDRQGLWLPCVIEFEQVLSRFWDLPQAAPQTRIDFH